jgi:hypothetical protein
MMREVMQHYKFIRRSEGCGRRIESYAEGDRGEKSG